MIRVVGHGLMECLSRDVALGWPATFEDVIGLLAVPPGMREHVLGVRGNVRLAAGDLVMDGDDEIHLYVVPMGG